MLNFDLSQQQRFLDSRFQVICGWLHPHIRQHFEPETVDLGDEDLKFVIEQSVQRARTLGATATETVSEFVHLRILFGEEFETTQWAGEVLGDRSLKGDALIAQLGRRARAVLALLERDE